MTRTSTASVPALWRRGADAATHHLSLGANRAGSQLRRFACRAFRDLRVVSRTLAGAAAQPDGDRIAVVLPRRADAALFGDICNRLAWYLGAADPADVADVHLDFHVPRHLLNTIPLRPDAQLDCFERLPRSARLVALGSPLDDYDHVVLARAASLASPRVSVALPRVSILDPGFFRGTEFGTSEQLMATTVDRERLAEADALSRRNFERLRERCADAPVSYALGTGPSLRELRESSHRFAGPVVSCNGIVCEPQLMAWLRPSVVCFADQVFFGPSRFAENLRQGALEAVARYGTFLAVPRQRIPLMLRQHPELTDHLIGLEIGATGWHVPTPDDPRVAHTANVMTLFVLPMCAALAQTVRVAGCDGAAPGKRATRNWKHVASSAESLSATAQRTHPAFYRDRSYGSDFEAHYRTLEDALSTWEMAGWWFETVTSSHIPALRRRIVANNTPEQSPAARRASVRRATARSSSSAARPTAGMTGR